MAWLETEPERDAWLAVMASLNSCETADELIESLLSSEDVVTPRTPHTPRLKTEQPQLVQAPEELSESDSSGTVKSTTKRKRRAPCRTKQTLDELRQTARECEAFLTVLKARQLRSGTRQLQQPHQVNDVAIASAHQLIAWKSIAHRQYQWRRESEQVNERLRMAVSEQAKIVQGLERLLKRSNSVLDATTPINRSLTDVEGSRHARRVNELLMSTSDMFAHVDDILHAAQLRRMQIETNELAWPQILPNGENSEADLMSMSHSRHVPCFPAIVADALWEYYAQSRGSSQSYYRERIETSSDTIVKSFHVRWENAFVVTNHRVIGVTRRMRQSNGVEVVVHLADFDGIEANPTRRGFRTHGWSIVRGVAPSHEWGAVSRTSDVLFKTVSRPIPPSMDVITEGEASQTTTSLLDRRHDLDTLVKFTLARHNEGVQRAIDNVMLLQK